MAKTKYVNFQTPIGIARFPHIEEPDARPIVGKNGKTQKADNKHKVELVFSDADTAAFKKVCQAAVKELGAGDKIPLKKGKKDGVISFIFKSTKKPVVVDAQKRRVPDGVKIGPGSRIRVAGSFAAYEGAFGEGITAYLDAVQIIELKDRFDATAGFDAVEDGFDATTVTPEAAFDDSTTSSSAAGDVLDL